jgi:hypothetical protein
MNRVVILLVLACAAASVFAADKKQVYKWTDANGVTHFSDAPPPKDTQNVQTLHMVGGMTAAAPMPTDEKPKDAAAGSTTPGAPGEAVPDEATLCKRSQSNLELLQGNTPVGIPGADGKATLLDDKAREAQIANAKVAIARFCK